jgi:hypothetical protein
VKSLKKIHSFVLKNYWFNWKNDFYSFNLF